MNEECKDPCPYTNRCEECEAYWDSMILEGLWDEDSNQWTDKAIREASRV